MLKSRKKRNKEEKVIGFFVSLQEFSIRSRGGIQGAFGGCNPNLVATLIQYNKDY